MTLLEHRASTTLANPRRTRYRPPPPQGSGGHRSAARAPRSFRPDIEGLRAVAVVTVVLYHADLFFDGGYVGVDVFFVISGFLITRQLTRTAAERGLGAIPTFYAHRVRRLLPAAVVVVLATVAAARVWAPPLQVRGIATDALFTTFYGLNYRLAVTGTDYQTIGLAASPLQHFWSLAVEEQFYVVWPLTVAIVVVLGRRLAPALLVVLTIAAVAASSWFSVTVTQESAPWAYFSLHTRAWELGVGALVALTAGVCTRIPRRLAGLLAWVGLGAIVSSAVLYTDATPFPGYAAWVPVAGTALVIAAGCGPRVGAERVLGEPLMQCLGRISYSLYLWHWPMLVLAPYAIGHDLSATGRGVVVWLSVLVALLSYLYVEDPARRMTAPDLRWGGIAVGLSAAVAATVALVVLVVPPSTTGTGARATLAQSDAAASTVPASMAAAIADGAEVQQAPANLTPTPTDARDSIPRASRNGCHAELTQVEQGACVFGVADAPRTVVLFGDSHMEQWLPTFVRAAEADRWRVVSWTKSACPPADLTVRNDALNRTYTECDRWRERTVARIGELDPDLVVVSGSETVVPADVAPRDYAAAMGRTLSAIGERTDAPVRYLHDVPIPGDDLPGCVAANLDDVRACGYDADGAYSHPDRHESLEPAAQQAGAETVDVQDWFCTDERCPAVVGNVLVYRDDSHMTVPYARWLTPLARSVLAGTASTKG